MSTPPSRRTLTYWSNKGCLFMGSSLVGLLIYVVLTNILVPNYVLYTWLIFFPALWIGVVVWHLFALVYRIFNRKTSSSKEESFLETIEIPEDHPVPFIILTLVLSNALLYLTVALLPDYFTIGFSYLPLRVLFIHSIEAFIGYHLGLFDDLSFDLL